jgi:hypothetical protein
MIKGSSNKTRNRTIGKLLTPVEKSAEQDTSRCLFFIDFHHLFCWSFSFLFMSFVHVETKLRVSGSEGNPKCNNNIKTATNNNKNSFGINETSNKIEQVIDFSNKFLCFMALIIKYPGIVNYANLII